jgi:hypothetical protein
MSDQDGQATGSSWRVEKPTPESTLAKARKEASESGRPVVIFAKYERNKPGCCHEEPKDITTMDPSKPGLGRPWELVYWVSPTGLERVMGWWIKWPWACAEAAKTRQQT